MTLAPSMPVLQGRGYRSDILGHLAACVATIEAAGGHIALESEAARLLPREGGGVEGAVVRHADGDIIIKAPWTLLATGGYQGSPELREKYIHPNARDMRLRANTASDGGGLRLGQSVGGHVSGENPGFYGHLVSDTPEWGDPRLYVPLTQYQSDRGLLINEQGERFCDENGLDHVNTQRVLAQPNGRALLVWDERLQKSHVVRSFVPDAPVIDRLAVALARGGQGGSFGTLEDLAAFASQQGFDGERTRHTIEAFNEDTRTGWEKIDPPRADNLDTVEEPPFHALVVYPAITFTHGGLSVDTQARVLDEDRRPIPGLLAAGADAGDVYKIGYAGGLSLAMTFGIRAARTAGYA